MVFRRGGGMLKRLRESPSFAEEAETDDEDARASPLTLRFLDPAAEHAYHASWARSFAPVLRLVAFWVLLIHALRFYSTLRGTAAASASPKPGGLPFWLADGGVLLSQALIVLVHVGVWLVARSPILVEGRYEPFHAFISASTVVVYVVDALPVLCPSEADGGARAAITSLHLFPFAVIAPCVIVNHSWWKGPAWGFATTALLALARSYGITQPFFVAEDVFALLNYSAVGALLNYLVEYRMRRAWILSRCLRRARDQAAAGLREKTLFLSNTNHEIRTPLFAIIGMTDVLQETALDAEQVEYVKTLRNSADVLLAMVSDILDLEKAGAGRLELEAAPFSPLAALEGVADMLFVSAARKHVDLACHVDRTAAGLRARGDSTRFKQVLLNLASNAVKFSAREAGETPGEVIVRLEAVEADAGAWAGAGAGPGAEGGAEGPGPGAAWLRLSVEDNGIGIAPERLPDLFRPFTQLDPSITRRYGGSGLGLALVKTLVERMGGSIAVASAPGQGSTFTVLLPFPEAAAEEKAGAARLEAEGEARAEGEGEGEGKGGIAAEGAAGDGQTGECGEREGREGRRRAVAALAALGYEAVESREGAGAVVTDDRSAAAEAAAGGLPVVFLEAPGARRRSVAVPELMELYRPASNTPPPPPGSLPGPSLRRLMLPVRLDALRAALAGAEEEAPLALATPLNAPPPGPADSGATRCGRSRARRWRRSRRRRGWRRRWRGRWGRTGSGRAPCPALLARMLRRLGYENDTVGDGAAAVEACKTGRYDVLFTDIAMPKMSGLEACAAVRALQAAGAVPAHLVVLGCSANALARPAPPRPSRAPDAGRGQAEDRGRALEAGMAAFLAKPCRLDQAPAPAPRPHPPRPLTPRRPAGRLRAARARAGGPAAGAGAEGAPVPALGGGGFAGLVDACFPQAP
eukprot:tig00021489_g21696.t1